MNRHWRNIPPAPKVSEHLYITGWRSRLTGYACLEHPDGHHPDFGDLVVDREKLLMGETFKCRDCGQELTWEP